MALLKAKVRFRAWKITIISIYASDPYLPEPVISRSLRDHLTVRKEAIFDLKSAITAAVRLIPWELSGKAIENLHCTARERILGPTFVEQASRSTCTAVHARSYVTQIWYYLTSMNFCIF